MLANCTQRTERCWQFQAFITTCTVTGCRLGLVALPDPGYDNSTEITPQMVWGAVMNRRGTMVDASGVRGTRTMFAIRTPTSHLSNATPQQPNNMVGYSAAILILYCLSPPIALHETVTLNATVLARCHLRCTNPAPGFGLYQLPLYHTDPQIPPGARPQWILEVASTAYNQSSATSTEGMYKQGFVDYHNGGAWCAGGWYFQFYGWGGPAPNSPSSGSYVTIYGQPHRMAVYKCEVPQLPWEDNDSKRKIPKYFASFTNPITYDAKLIGFQTLEHAMMQARGDTGMIPHGAELCIRYNKTPTWKESFPHSDGSGSRIALKFYMVWQSEKSYPWGGPVYSTIVSSTGLSAYTSTYTTTTAGSNPTFRSAALVAPDPLSSTYHQSQVSSTLSHQPLMSLSAHTPYNQTPGTLPSSQEIPSMPSARSLNMEDALRGLQAMQQQMTELLNRLSIEQGEHQPGCQCPGACSCPAQHSVELDIADDPLLVSSDSGSEDTVAAPSDTEWDTETQSDDTQAMQDHMNWVQQQQNRAEQIAARHRVTMQDTLTAIAMQQQEHSTPSAPPPVAPHAVPNWGALLNRLRGHRQA